MISQVALVGPWNRREGSCAGFSPEPQHRAGRVGFPAWSLQNGMTELTMANVHTHASAYVGTLASETGQWPTSVLLVPHGPNPRKEVA